MLPENLAEYQAIPNDLVDLSNSFVNKSGVSFLFQQTPSIYASFISSNVTISNITLQPTYNGKTTNIRQFSVNYITPDNKQYVNPKTGEVVRFTSPDDGTLSIQHPMISGLKGFNLTILKTTAGKPTYFRVGVYGCYKQSKFISNRLFFLYFLYFSDEVTYIIPGVPTAPPPVQTTGSRTIIGTTVSESGKIEK
jgi:hypothetical protein